MKPSTLPKDPRGDWFRKNPEAHSFTETWMEMSSAGTTDYTLTRFFKEILRKRYRFPWKDIQSTARWLRNTYGDTYDMAMAQRRTRY